MVLSTSVIIVGSSGIVAVVIAAAEKKIRDACDDALLSSTVLDSTRTVSELGLYSYCL
jgi:hypothetical protein